MAATVTPVRVGARSRLAAATVPRVRTAAPSHRPRSRADTCTSGTAMTIEDAQPERRADVPPHARLEPHLEGEGATATSAGGQPQRDQQADARARPELRASARRTSSGSSDVTRRAAKHDAKSAAAMPAAATRQQRSRASTTSRSTGKRSWKITPIDVDTMPSSRWPSPMPEREADAGCRARRGCRASSSSRRRSCAGSAPLSRSEASTTARCAAPVEVVL